jgi:hypothetical protein
VLQGEYADKRKQGGAKLVKCHKAVFILTTNLLDELIQAYFLDVRNLLLPHALVLGYRPISSRPCRTPASWRPRNKKT